MDWSLYWPVPPGNCEPALVPISIDYDPIMTQMMSGHIHRSLQATRKKLDKLLHGPVSRDGQYARMVNVLAQTPPPHKLQRPAPLPCLPVSLSLTLPISLSPRPLGNSQAGSAA